MDKSKTSPREHNTYIPLPQQRLDHLALPVPQHQQYPTGVSTQQSHAPVLQSCPSRSALASQHSNNEVNANQAVVTTASGLNTYTQHDRTQYAAHGTRLYGPPQVLQPMQGYQAHVTDTAYRMSWPTAPQLIDSTYRQELQHALQSGSVPSGSTGGPYGTSQHVPSYYEPQQLTGVPTQFTMTQQLDNPHQRDSYGYSGVSVPQTNTYAAVDMGLIQPSQSYIPPEPQRTQTFPPHIDPVYHDYQTRIRGIFTLVLEGDLRDINRHLIAVAHYLLDNVEALGLSNDVVELYDERMGLWDEFNNAWLTALQRQLDLTERIFRANASLPESQSIMTEESLQTLAAELIRMCNDVERHGLVDYQMGVAEEQIIDLLMRCISLLNPTGSSESENSQEG